MALQVLLLLVGLALVVFGADWLVDGASAIARKVGISEFVIGLTIVGFGTSCPELVVSLTGAFKGLADISIGNVIGSNIFNTLLILGVTALLSPLAITSSNKKRDIPIVIFVTVLFVAFGLTGKEITRIEGVIFLLLFIVYMIVCFKTDKVDENEEVEEKQLKLFAALAFVLAGLCGLIFGGRLFVDSAVNVAKALGVSDKFIAITILAGGTSMPELATCVVAAFKHKQQLALGNILGSNVFNILLIIGASSIVMPLSFASMNIVDLGALLISGILLFTACYTGKKNELDRLDAAIFLAFEIAYMILLILSI